MRLSLKKNNPVHMVGDGEAPNIFWVSASTDFSYRIPNAKKDEPSIDYAEKLMKEHGIKSKQLSMAVFSTIKEAVAHAKKLVAKMPDEPEKDGIHRVTIEDRWNGTYWEWEKIAISRGKWGGWMFEVESHGIGDIEE